MVKIHVSDRRKQYPDKTYTLELDLSKRDWYKVVLDQYAKDNSHPPLALGESPSRYYARFWAEVLKGEPAAPAPKPVPIAPLVTATNKGRVFTVNRKGVDYSFESILTDEQAVEVCRRISPQMMKDKAFAQDLLAKLPNVSAKQLAWIHKLAIDQLKREGDPKAKEIPLPPPPVQQGTDPRPIRSRYKPQGRKKTYWPKESHPANTAVATPVEELDESKMEQVSAFASDLGIGRPNWPETVEFEGMEYTKWKEEVNKEGELQVVKYHSDGIFLLTVFNT